MMSPAEYREFAKECERLAKDGPARHRPALLKIAEAWRQCALEAERQGNSGSHLDRTESKTENTEAS